MPGNEPPPLKPVLQKPPGYYKNPNNVPAVRGMPPRRVLPPSFSRKAKKRRSFRRRFCCCFCISILILIVSVLVFGLVFYVWFRPMLPSFHLQSFRLTRFDVTRKPDGTYLDAAASCRIEVKNPNENKEFSYGATEVAVSVDEEETTELVSASLGEFRQAERSTTSLRVETKVSGQLVDDGLGTRLKVRYRSKGLVPNVEARTKVGVGILLLGLNLKIGMLGVNVKCGGVALKRLEGPDSYMPKCTIKFLEWINIH